MKVQSTFLSINCIPTFTKLTIPEATKHFGRQETYWLIKNLYCMISLSAPQASGSDPKT